MDIDASSIASIFLEEQTQLMRMLVRKGMPAHTAADVVQEAFVRVLRVPNGEIRDVKSYLRRTVQNIAIDLHRNEVRAKAVFDLAALVDDSSADPGPLADAAIISREEEAALHRALCELPTRCREVLVLHKFEGLSYAEIAGRLGIAKNTVMVHMVRAIGHLRSRLRENKPSGAN